MDKAKYDKISKIIGIIIGIALVLSISYAVYKRTAKGDNSATVEAGRLGLRIDNEEDEIEINNAAPMTDKKGMQMPPYKFDVINDGTIDAMYKLYLEIDNDSNMPLDKVKYFLTRIDDGGEEINVTDKPNKLTYKKISLNSKGNQEVFIDIDEQISVNTTNNYKLYLWIDESAILEEIDGKNIIMNVTIKGSQINDSEYDDPDEKVLIRKVDVSENNDGSVYAYLYTDNTINIRGIGRIKAGLSDTEEFQEISLNNVSIEEGVTNIPQGLYTGNEEIEEVILPTTITSIDNEAFAYCANLKNIIVDDNTAITSFGESTFRNCTSLEDINRLIVDLRVIPAYTFYNCTSLDDVVIPTRCSGVHDTYSNIELEANAFGNCIGMKKLTIPHSIGIFDQTLFAGVTNLEEVHFSLGCDSWYSPDYVKYYNGGGMSTGENKYTPWYLSREYLTKITYDDNVRTIGSAIFRGLTSLNNITLPAKLNEIKEYAFYECSDLSLIESPNTLTTIGRSAFWYCGNLESINIPNGVSRIEMRTFQECSNLSSVKFSENLTIICNYAFQNCTSLEEVILPETLTTMEGYAFYNCISIKKLVWPVKLAISSSTTFTNVANLEELTLIGTGDMANYNNSSYEYTPWYKSRNKIQSIVINDGITSIGSFMFCSIPLSLDRITIPDSVTRFGDGVFMFCPYTTFRVPDNVVSIGNSCFAGCSSLTSIDLNNVTSIGDSAFRSCRVLDSITLPVGVTTISKYMFSECNALTNITFLGDITSIGVMAFASCTSLNSITIPNSVVSVEMSVFYNWTSSQTINIDNTSAYVSSNWDTKWNYKTNAQINYLKD